MIFLRKNRKNRKTVKEIQRINSIFSKIGYELGTRAEDSVNESLMSGKASNLLPSWLHAWTCHPRYSTEDSQGIDLTIHTDIGDIPLQVKSSEINAYSFSKKHPGIPVVVIDVTKTSMQLYGKIMKAIRIERDKRIAGGKVTMGL